MLCGSFRAPVGSGLLMIALWTLPTAAARADDWPQWLGPKRDGVWREDGILDKFPAGGPKVRWRTPIAAGYSGPAVADGKVFITDRMLAAGAKNPKSPFGRKDRVGGTERVLCLDDASGKVLWQHEYDCPYQVSYAAGPRTSPVVHQGKVYTLGTMGNLFCFDAASGKVLWSKDFVKDFNADVPLWGFAAHPLIDGDRLVCLVGGDLGVAVAFHKDTGEVLWKALKANEIGYAPPMIYDVAGRRQLIIWHPESINSLDPVTGKLYWSQPFPGKKGLKAALSIPTPRLDGDRLFVTAFYDGPLMLKVTPTGPQVLWRGKGRGEMPDDTDGLHSIMSTPFLKDGHVYGVCSYGELRCLNADTGARLWSTHQATGGKPVRWANAFIVPQGDRYFLFNEHGDLIIARLTPKGYDEVSRANLLAPTNTMAGPPGRLVLWSHPAFAHRSIYARNDQEIVCVSLAAP